MYGIDDVDRQTDGTRTGVAQSATTQYVGSLPQTAMALTETFLRIIFDAFFLLEIGQFREITGSQEEERGGWVQDGHLKYNCTYNYYYFFFTIIKIQINIHNKIIKFNCSVQTIRA